MKASYLRALVLLSVACGPDPRSCPESEPACTDQCIAGERRCDGDASIEECAADGSWQDVGVCQEDFSEGGSVCREGACVSLCEAAGESSSYIGCEYFPTVTLNYYLTHTTPPGETFDFAVAVGNTQPVAVTVVVERGGIEVASQVVDPGTVGTVVLPWVPELLASRGTVMLARAGSYRLTTSRPVPAYQFNPLQYQITDDMAVQQFSYTNDASLLLPKQALGDEYRVMSRRTLGSPPLNNPTEQQGTPGYFAVVATEDGTSVDIAFTGKTSIYERPGQTPRRFGPGDVASFALQRGDVLQVPSQRIAYEASDLEPRMGGGYQFSKAFDLTGTSVHADKPVALFSGHACDVVPDTRRCCCDHTEEQLPPVNSWSDNALAATTWSPPSDNAPTHWKVLSGGAANQITFDPPDVHAPVTLGEGEDLEFAYRGGFSVRGSNRLLVGQLLPGVGSETDPIGDPSFGVAIPPEQYRTSYIFLVPETYTSSFVQVYMPLAASPPTLDGIAVPAAEPIGSSGYGVVVIPIEPGTHQMSGDAPFGINLLGLAPWTSYLVPGGMDVNVIPIE